MLLVEVKGDELIRHEWFLTSTVEFDRTLESWRDERGVPKGETTGEAGHRWFLISLTPDLIESPEELTNYEANAREAAAYDGSIPF
jgi:hypothetical protein